MSKKKLRLSDILEGWLADHKFLKDHYHVYRIKQWNKYTNGEWPYWLLGDAKAFVGMTCDGISIALAVQDDRIYYRNTEEGPKFETLAADIEFFPKIEKDLIKFHKKSHKGKKCEPF